MSDLDTLLGEALESWEYARHGLLAEAESIPEDQYGFRPAPESRSVAELLAHIIESGRMMAGELSRPDGDFRRQSFAEHLVEHGGPVSAEQSKAELLELLRRSGEEGRRRIREFGEVGMLQRIRRFDGQEGTRLAWMNHGIDHEMYHRGQLALYVRLTGGVPALTRQIHGDS